MVGPRFEQTNETFQPRPLAAIELIQDEPIRLVEGRTAACDGGGGALGHPRVFVNLDKPGPHACSYWCAHLALGRSASSAAQDLTPNLCLPRYSGIRYERDHSHHH